MEKTMINRVEQKLRRHYRRVRQLERFEKALVATRERIVLLEERIRNCCHCIENPLKSPSFDGMPKGGQAESPIERALISSFEKMERELGKYYLRQADLTVAINRICEETEIMDLILADLDDEARKIINCRYSLGYTFRQMEEMLFSDHVSMHRIKDKALEWISNELAEVEAIEKGPAEAEPCGKAN